MKKLKTETKVGIIAILTISILVWGINFLKGKDLFGRQYTYYAVYEDIGGLLPTSYVFVNGMKVGQVSNISYADPQMSKFIVKFELPSDLQIPDNSLAEVYNSDILGSKAMRVVMGNSKKYFAAGDTMLSHTEGSMLGEIGKILEPYTEKLDNILCNVDTVMASVKVLTDNETQQRFHSSMRNIEAISGRLSSLSANLDNIVVSEKDKVKDIINDVEKLSSTLSDNSEKLENIVSNISGISDDVAKANLGQTLSNLNKTIDELSVAMDKITKGKGNVGKLINDGELYDNLQKTISDLDKLVNDIQNNPKKYINVSVF